MTLFTIDRAAIDKAVEDAKAPIDLSGINFGMLEMLELWAEREWQKKQNGEKSEWDQGIWMSVRGEEETGTACGTACCLAGKAISITPGIQWAMWDDSADEIVPVEDITAVDIGKSFDDVYLPAALVPEEYRYESYKIERDGQTLYRVDANDAGAAILGLNSSEASALFEASNELEDVKRIVAEIKNGDYRRDSNAVQVEVATQPRCNLYAGDYVRELSDGANVYVGQWGRCTLPEHDDKVEHLFSSR